MYRECAERTARCDPIQRIKRHKKKASHVDGIYEHECSNAFLKDSVLKDSLELNRGLWCSLDISRYPFFPLSESLFKNVRSCIILL